MVSGSLLVRGVVTAINWIRPPAYDFSCFDSFEGAVMWVEERRGRKIAIASKLLAEARAQLDLP